MKVGNSRIAASHTLQDDSSAPIITANDSPPVVVDFTLLTKYLDSLPLQTPRLLSRQQAAGYCGVALETFDDYRRRGIVPDPINGTQRWDRKLIDQWLDKASGITSSTTSPLDEWRTKRHG